MRSELIKKFPNLHITAPYSDNNDNCQKLDDAVRVETLDEDLLLVLFDRAPGRAEFEGGITIQPPGHQLSFTFGNGTWSFTDSVQMFREEWRGVLVPQYNGQVNPQGAGKNQYSSTTSPVRGFDFKYNVLLPAGLGADARDSVSIGGANDSLSSLLGSQLIAAFPKLTILDAPPSNLDKSPCIPLQRVGWTCIVDSEQGPDTLGINVLDGDPQTYWHTEWEDFNSPGLPHTITIDMKAMYQIGGLTYLPRQDGGSNGMIEQYEILVRSAFAHHDPDSKLTVVVSMTRYTLHRVPVLRISTTQSRPPSRPLHSLLATFSSKPLPPKEFGLVQQKSTS